MTTRSEELAEEFKKANDEFIALIERLDEKQWQARCQGEGWTVAVAANHLALDEVALADVVKTVGTGMQAGFTMQMLDQMNAEQAEEGVSCTKREVLEKLRTNGAIAAEAIRGLSDEQLQNFDLLPANNPVRVLHDLPEKVTARDWIESVLIDHFREHGSSILAAAYPALATRAQPAVTASAHV